VTDSILAPYRQLAWNPARGGDVLTRCGRPPGTAVDLRMG
jgi:hypothetical protein